ncbi:MAG TPA: MFS transporter [Actinomycetota bacterium]|nr:MFS transporter [Actinomycetota bacterium]
MSTREPVESLGGLRASLSLLRRNADFRRLYLASFISLGGDWFLLVALFDLVLELTGSAMTIAVLIVCQEIPFFFMSPVGGAIADRLDRKRVMIVCDVVRAGLCLGFLLVSDTSTLWIAYLLLACISSFSAAFDPASSAAFPNLVDPGDLGPANALFGSLWGTMLALGAALGGIVAATLGRDAAFIVDASSFAISAALLARIHRPFHEERDESEEHPSVVRATIETARYARDDHRVLALLSVKAGFGLVAGVVVLIAVFAEEVYGAGAIGIGVLMAARGLGALVGPFLGRWAAGERDRRLFTAIAMALGVFGLGYTAFGLMPTLLLAAPTVAIAHLGGGAQWTLSSYGLQRVVEDRIRGRIFAFDNALITLTFTISSVVTAWTTTAFGERPAAVALGVSAIAYAGLWTLLTTDQRRRTAREGLEVRPSGAATDSR